MIIRYRQCKILWEKKEARRRASILSTSGRGVNTGTIFRGETYHVPLP